MHSRSLKTTDPRAHEHAETENVGFPTTRQASRAQSAKRHEVFGQCHEGWAASCQDLTCEDDFRTLGGIGGKPFVLSTYTLDAQLVRYIGSTFRLSNFVNYGIPYSNIVPMPFLLLNKFLVNILPRLAHGTLCIELVGLHLFTK